MPNPRPNPYVGPRPFQTGEKIYGRDRETRELLNLLIAERIVLLYSPSGAGKTSLIQAALLPKLREEEFAVLPPMRVNSEPPALPQLPEARRSGPITNRYVLSTLLSLEEAQPREIRLPLAQLAQMTFSQYLNQRADLADKNPVLLFDQFEEIITAAPMERDAKFAFFEQIGEALRDRSRWALFSMREDYIAGLDPYILPLPTRFSTRYRLDLLGADAARAAIQKPARDEGVEFTNAAAQKLINDLRQVHVQRPDGTMEIQPGLYVEPVQLQVVCLRLWNNLEAGDTEISERDIAQVGDVNSALASYYQLRVSAVSVATGESERVLREWFDRQLITEAGVRGQVLMEPERSRGLSNTAIRMLENAHLVRADERRGATWFELAHDRLIEPIRNNNATWFQENLSAFQQQADLWERQGRPDGLLLRGKAWDEGYLWAQQHAQELTPVEQAFFKESDQEDFRLKKERRTQRRIRNLAFGATALSVIAILGICVALISLAQLGNSLQETDQARAEAIAKGDEANSARVQAQQQERVSKMTNAALSQLNVDPETSLLLAMQAYSTTQSVQTDDILRQAVIESRVRGTLRGHTDSVDSVAVSPDGNLFATASGDGTAILWDAATGKQVHVLKAHTAPVWGVAFSPDGETVLTTSADNTARLWDLTQCGGETCPSRALQGHSAPVWGGAFSPDGEVFATVSDDGTAKLWQTDNGEFLGDLGSHAQGINGIAFSPDGHYFATVSSDQTAQITDITACDSGKCEFHPFETQAALWSVAFSPDSTYMVVASDDQNAYKINLATNSIENQLSGHSDSVLSVAYSPDGKYIASGSRDGTARIWDANTGQVIAILRGHDNSVWSVAFTPDSRLLLTGSADTTARVWDISDNDALRVLRGTLNKVLGADYSSDGRRVISVGADRAARVYDVDTGAVIAKLAGHNGWLSDGALNHDGTRAATASFDNTARIWDLQNCAPDCAFIELKGHEGIVRSIVFSPDEKFILTASDDMTARLWDAATGALVKTFSGHEGALNHASFNHAGTSIITAGNDRTAVIWDVASAAPELTLVGHAGAINSATFNAQDTLVATASDDRTARIWDIAHCADNNCPFQELKGHLGAVTGAVFTQDGKNIVTSSADKTARVWDANTLQTTSILRGHTDKVQTVELSPDDNFVMTASSDKTVRIVPLAIQKVLELARSRVTRALSCDEWALNLGDPNYCPGGGITQNANALPTLAPVTRIAVVAPTGAIPPQSNATATAPPASPTARATVDLSKPSGGGGAVSPTLSIETPIASPTVENIAPTATPETIELTPTLPIVATAVPATPTPNLAPGVYVSRIVYQPLDAPNFQFKLTFVNTTGAPVTYPNWRVPFYEPGAKNSVGAPKGLDKTIPVGTTELLTETWKVGVGQCTAYTAKPVSEDGDGRQTQFVMPDGQPAALDFQICPP